MLCVNRIPPEQHKTGFQRCSSYFEYHWSKNLTVCSPINSLLCGIPNTAGATLCGTSSSNEHYNSAGGASFCCAVCRSNVSSPPAVSYHRAGANSSAGNPPPRGNPGLKCTRTDAILKKFEYKMNFNLKINLNRDLTNFRSIQQHNLQPSPISWDYPFKHQSLRLFRFWKYKLIFLLLVGVCVRHLWVLYILLLRQVTLNRNLAGFELLRFQTLGFQLHTEEILKWRLCQVKAK
jgi:hypothetical protein